MGSEASTVRPRTATPPPHPQARPAKHAVRAEGSNRSVRPDVSSDADRASSSSPRRCAAIPWLRRPRRGSRRLAPSARPGRWRQARAARASGVRWSGSVFRTSSCRSPACVVGGQRAPHDRDPAMNLKFLHGAARGRPCNCSTRARVPSPPAISRFQHWLRFQCEAGHRGPTYVVLPYGIHLNFMVALPLLCLDSNRCREQETEDDAGLFPLLQRR